MRIRALFLELDFEFELSSGGFGGGAEQINLTFMAHSLTRQRQTHLIRVNCNFAGAPDASSEG